MTGKGEIEKGKNAVSQCKTPSPLGPGGILAACIHYGKLLACIDLVCIVSEIYYLLICPGGNIGTCMGGEAWWGGV